MFEDNYLLTNLDLSSFNTVNVTTMAEMFNNCKALTTITVSNSFVTTKVTNSTDMFNSCTSLKGSSGTTYNSSKVDKTYAHIDGGTSNPGYFSK